MRSPLVLLVAVRAVGGDLLHTTLSECTDGASGFCSARSALSFALWHAEHEGDPVWAEAADAVRCLQRDPPSLNCVRSFARWCADTSLALHLRVCLGASEEWAAHPSDRRLVGVDDERCRRAYCWSEGPFDRNCYERRLLSGCDDDAPCVEVAAAKGGSFVTFPCLFSQWDWHTDVLSDPYRAFSLVVLALCWWL